MYYVIIPVFNEEKYIEKSLEQIKKYTKNIIVVDDGSKDKTYSILKKIEGIHVIKLKKNMGKGAAMRKGANLAWRLKAKGIIFMDGDNQHNPKYLPVFFEHLNNKEHIIIGIRILKAGTPLLRKLGNKLLIYSVRVLFNVYLEDLICGYRGFSKEGYKQILWESDNYGVETEVVTLIGRKKLPFKKIIVDTIYLDKYKGFSIKDGLKIVIKLPYWRVKKI